MSNEAPAVTCPKCGASFALDAALAAPLEKQYKQQLKDSLAEADRDRERAVADAEKIAAARARKESLEALKLAQDAAADAERQAESLQTKLTIAQEAQAAALRKERELADKERELDLTIETRIYDATSTIRSSALRESDEANRLKLLEKDTLLQQLETKVADLQTKLTQGSQQSQGEVQELDLEQQLRAKFPHDQIGEVAKGVNGADITQEVMSPSGHHTGLILWESKRTKRWSDGWLPKLRDDGRKAHADLLVIVSAALPEEVESFYCIDNVWVCSPQAAVPMAMALRTTLLAVHNVKQTQAGMATKAESVYSYVTGPQFKHRVEALVEAFTTMQEELTAEQKATQRQWAKRAVQIERVLTSTSGMFGDLQGIAGSKALPEPSGLSLSDGGGE